MTYKSPTEKLKKFFVRALIVITAYVALVAFPLQYLPLPGYRAIGEPITGGWRWGGAFGCFDNVPVLYFEERDAFLVREGQMFWKLIENIELKTKDSSLELTGTIYSVNIKNPEASIKAGSIKPQRLRINYKDNGKILIVKEMHMNGAPVHDKILLKSYILAQCGYPGLTLFLLRTLGIKKYWREPRNSDRQERDIIEVR